MRDGCQLHFVLAFHFCLGMLGATRRNEMSASMDMRQQIAFLIGERPGITAPELHEFFKETSYASFSSIVSSVYNKGGLRRERIPKTNKFRYFIDKGAKPERAKIRMRQPTDAGLKARLDEATSKIEALEKWKADAIARFPELGVDPLVLQARAIVAKILRANGDNTAASRVLSGDRDSTVALLATVDALAEAAA